LLKKLGFSEKVQIDTSRLIITGHSFGGITAINLAKSDARIKLCATLDPWLYAYHNEIIKGEYKLDLPHIVVSSAHFHPSAVKIFPSWDTTKKLFSHSKDKR
jgi:dienelactone hydrolase